MPQVITFKRIQDILDGIPIGVKNEVPDLRK
jgi:hypothetical protein